MLKGKAERFGQEVRNTMFVKLFKIIFVGVSFFFLIYACAYNVSEKKHSSAKARYIFLDKNSGLYGLLDKNGKEVLNPKYKHIGWMKEGMMPAFTKDEQFVIIGANGFPIKNVRFWDISPFYTEDLLGVADVETKNWGFVDRNLDYVIKPQFEQVGYFNGEVTVAKKNNLWGVIDKKGEFIIDPVFSEIKGYGKGTLVASKNGKIKVVKMLTKTVSESEYDEFYGMTGEMAVVEKEGSIYLSSGDRTLLLMKKPGGMVYDVFNHAFLGENRFYLKYSENNNVRHIAVFSISDGKIICDKEGWLEIEPLEYNKDLFKVKTSENEEKWIDKNCIEKDPIKILENNIKPVYQNTGKNKYDKVRRSICEENDKIDSFKLKGKWGCLNEKGEISIPAIYDEVQPFYKGRSKVYKDGKRYIIDLKGKIIFEIKENWGSINELNFIEPICYGWGLASIISEDYWFSRETIKKMLKRLDRINIVGD